MSNRDPLRTLLVFQESCGLGEGGSDFERPPRGEGGRG